MIARQLALELGLLKLVRPRIDLRQKVALLDHSSFGEPDLGELTVNLGLHRNRCDRCDSAKRVDDDTDIARADGRGTNRLRRPALRGAPARRRRLSRGC